MSVAAAARASAAIDQTASADRSQIGSDQRWPWSVTLVVAAVSTTVPLIASLALSGLPVSRTDWQVMAAAAALGLAVLLSRVRVELAIAVLCLSLLTVFPAASVAMSAVGVWQSMAGLALYAGVCWVTSGLGRQLPVRRSTLWMAGYIAAVVVGLDFDVALAMLGVGWWVVGVTFRHRERLAGRLQERANELADEQERFADEAVRLERARIARELHDVVAHCMTVIVIQARAGRELAQFDPASAAEALDAILATAREAETDLQALVGVMDGSAARPTIRNLLDSMVQRAVARGTPVRLRLHGDLGSLDAVRSAVAHRVVQEALTNALRYAPGAPVSIELDCRTGLTLAVTNGPATPAASITAGSGRGLAGIAERSSALGGTAVWGPTSAGGWRLAVSLP
ncbi:MAG TPA: histidine kinase [Microlunatus sp.]|nr:histidine kinase [Microlunatus sp.]